MLPTEVYSRLHYKPLILSAMGPLFEIILALFVVVVTYYVYNPLPKSMEQPVFFNTVLTMSRIVEDLGKISQALGWKELAIFRRDVGGLLSPLAMYANEPLGDDIKVTATTFDGVPVSIYQSATRTVNSLEPGFAYIHGGGFVQGSAAGYDSQMAQIVRDTGVVVMSIDYRLAPEHPSPAVLDDCVAATSHFYAHAEDWGVDAGRIGVGGDSAGGNMAAVLAQKYRDMEGTHQFSYQVLIYPRVQALDFSLPSHINNAKYNAPMQKPCGIALIVLKYLGQDERHVEKLSLNQHVTKATQERYKSIMDVKNLGSQYHSGFKRQDHGVDEELAAKMEPLITNPYNYPLMASTLEGLPPAFIITGGFDTIRDDGLLYLDRLIKSGVKTKHYHDDLGWHGAFCFATGKSVSGRRMLQQVVKYINQVKASTSYDK